MKTLDETLNEVVEKKGKVFLLQFTANIVDDRTLEAWKKNVSENADFIFTSIERNGGDKNVVRVVVAKGASVAKLKRLWMIERVWKSE